ncbi:G kinase-anchoring protein 1-like isoform X1 [Eriocheir sinensis]|uniref:G kinase-anchoring protein 1-like isoform X1 n=1 Tax=Eriocheir sinensis TaxID=95602 RepID=UPI0021C9BFDE|nr:G kinase-anchoring protein 1-like isoform X1 [Eriocheir sinensis]
MAGRSGFSVLAIDVDLDERAGKKKSDKQKPKTEESSKRSAGNKTPSKKKKAAPSITAVDSGQPSSGPAKIKNKKKSGKAVNGTDKDGQNKGNEHPHLKVDDDWQRRDDEFVRDENERSLREAMMLSKLDFEEKKLFYAQMKKDQQDEPRGSKGKKKKDKPLTMSLDQFNSLHLNQLTGRQEPEEPEGSASERMPKEEKFFENIDEAARKTLEKENRHENYKITAGQFNQALRATQYEAELEKRDFEIQALRLEVDSLKDDLKLVKGRNKKLCEVISASEMKSKAELVVELDKMTKVRDELTQEVQNLSAQLEQERSKVNQLSLDVKKAHGKKKQNNADAGNKD